MSFDALDQPGRLQFLDDALARYKAIQAAQMLRRMVVEPRVRGKHVDRRQRVAGTDGVIVEVMRRRDLQTAGSEGRIHVLIADDRNVAGTQRQSHRMSDQVAIALILRVHGHGGVTQHGFRARRGDDHVPGTIAERIAQIPQVAVFFLRQHLQVRERRAQHRIPVHQPLAAINETFFVQAHERLDDPCGKPRVHRKALARPIHRRPESTHLTRNRAAGLLLPLPDAGDEFLARQVGALLAGGIELAFDHHLCGDSGVVQTRLPKTRIATHAMLTGECIHDRVLERVSHVQRAGHIRRRDHDTKLGGPPRAAQNIRPIPNADTGAVRYRQASRPYPSRERLQENRNYKA